MNPKELLSTEIAYAKLRDGIFKGRFAARERLTTQRLAEELGLSRTPVREALARLETDGLVSRIENWGYAVRQITLRDAEEIFEARLVIETAAAGMAAERACETELDGMRLCLLKADAKLSKQDLSGFQIEARNFHKQIVQATGNVCLFRMFAQLNDLVLLFGLSLLKTRPLRAAQISTENAEIFKAIKLKDSIKAYELMKKHIQTGHETFREISRSIRLEMFLN